MCIAIPGKIVSRQDGTGYADVRGNRIPVDLRLVDAVIGDFVLIHAGCAIEILQPEEALDLESLLTEIEELGHEQP